MFLRLLFVLGILLALAESQTCPSVCRSRMKRLSKRIKSLETQIGTIGSTGGGGGPGAVYTRWGRKSCPENNAQLYEGFAAGSHYTHVGGGANYLCMPNEPQFANVKDGQQSCGGFIYGAEYEVCGPWQTEIFGVDDSVHDHNVPCAVCQATNRQSKVFIPARTECPTGWAEEYKGYVMGAHHAHYRYEWVCVDAAPETSTHGEKNENGALFYFAEAKCGVLPCPPYKDGNEIPCVVCTK